MNRFTKHVMSSIKFGLLDYTCTLFVQPIPLTNPCISKSEYFWVNQYAICLSPISFSFPFWKLISEGILMIFVSIIITKWFLLKNAPTSRLKCKNHALFMTEAAKKPYPLGHTYLYRTYACTPGSTPRVVFKALQIRLTIDQRNALGRVKRTISNDEHLCHLETHEQFWLLSWIDR